MKKKRHRKGRGKNKPVSNEAGYLARAIAMTSFVRKLQSQPSEFIYNFKGEDKAKTKLWEFAVAGKPLSEIDSVLAKMRAPKRSKLNDLVWGAWLNLYGPFSGYDPTHDEIIAEFW